MTDDHVEHLVFVSAEQDIAGSLGLVSLEDIFKMQGPLVKGMLNYSSL